MDEWGLTICVGSFSSFRKSVQEGTGSYSELASGVRRVCKEAILDNFEKNRSLALHADRLLDKVNNALTTAEAPVERFNHNKRYNQASESGQAGRSLGPASSSKPINEFLQVTFNPAYLDVKADGRDLRSLILKANPSLAISEKNEKLVTASGLVGCGSLKVQKSATVGESSGCKKRSRTQSEAREMPFDDVFQKLLAGALAKALGDMTPRESIHQVAKLVQSIVFLLLWTITSWPSP